MVVGQEGVSPARDAESPTVPGKHQRPTARTVDRLLRRVARGDAEAFGAVYDQVADEVYGLVSRIVGDQYQAEQVAEEVLAEVWRSAPRFSPAEGSGLNWIMAMARCRAISQVRAARDGRTAGLEPAEAPVEVGQAAGSLLARPDVKSLPGPQREAVLLAWRGHTWRQVAVLVGVPASTAAELLREGLLGLGSPE
jgi:RNA polymerase sigma-70 factor (ECF subfamily)